jgi:hypothetical protein
MALTTVRTTPDRWTVAATARSTNGRDNYLIEVNQRGEFRCGCEHFKWTKTAPKHCKHIGWLEQELADETTSAPPEPPSVIAERFVAAMLDAAVKATGRNFVMLPAEAVRAMVRCCFELLTTAQATGRVNPPRMADEPRITRKIRALGDDE